MRLTATIRALAIVAAAAAAVPASAGQISLAWDPVSGASGYKIYYGTSSGTYTQSVAVAGTAATITGLSDCQTWFAAVKAYNGGGESAQFSNEVSGWPRPDVTGATPGTAQQGAQITINLSGTNFQTGATVDFNNPNVILSSVRVLSCSQIQLLANIAPAGPNVRPAQIGKLKVSVANPDTVFGERSDTFEITVNPARFDINKTDSTTTNRVDGKDTVWLARLFGSQEGGAVYDPDSDFDGDGWVDGNDLAYIAANLGRCWSGTDWSIAACPASLK